VAKKSKVEKMRKGSCFVLTFSKVVVAVYVPPDESKEWSKRVMIDLVKGATYIVHTLVPIRMKCSADTSGRHPPLPQGNSGRSTVEL
jgi:hypothetical protein